MSCPVPQPPLAITSPHALHELPKRPNVHSEILSHIHVRSWVVQEEHVTGLVLGEPVPEFTIPSAYRVEDGKIVKCIGLQ
jgi:hypothetical protein